MVILLKINFGFKVYWDCQAMDDNKKQNTDFEKEFVRDQLIKVARNSAAKGIPADVFEALLITLSDEIDFKAVMIEN